MSHPRNAYPTRNCLPYLVPGLFAGDKPVYRQWPSPFSWKQNGGNKKSLTRWWFQTFFIFTPIWGRFPF